MREVADHVNDILNWSLENDTTTNATASVYGDTNGATGQAANSAGNANMGNIDLQDATRAATANSALDIAISGASAEVAKYGAYINRLEHASDNLLNVAQNTDASRARLKTLTTLKKPVVGRTQIITQAGTAMPQRIR